MESRQSVAPGAIIAVHQHRVGAQRRVAEVLEVLGSEGHLRYRVRWDDGHESIFCPGEDAVVERVGGRGGSGRRKTARP